MSILDDWREEEHIETNIPIPKGFIFTFINAKGKKRKLMVWHALFICFHCSQQQQLVLNSREKKMQITEYHYQECPYFEERK
jgi:hypothetical protein